MNGKNVDLVAVERDHLPAFKRWLNNPEVTRYLNWYLPLSMDGEEKWFSSLAGEKNAVYFTILLKNGMIEGHPLSTSTAIGNCTLRIDWKNRVGNAGIMIGEKSCWGKGYGTEAMQMLVDYGFATLNMNRIELETFDFNERARKSYGSVGFKEEGCRREAHYIEGKYNDVMLMALLKSEWHAKS